MPRRARRHGEEERPVRRRQGDRLSSARRGYGRRWRRYRAAYLARHLLCVVCGAIATQVDHIERVNGPGDPLFWVEANHQALCHSCHSKKTAKEDR